ncbi:sirohydrochlorin chelatase [Rhodococcus sp. HNM0569]|uniref:sirohydrochlorin chelatase n=1 Tax=Rhodococcus sp. HNM0569 TaxID=2716340 RepID=UPI00146DBCC8|nr:sirohydrochlorin chelatase [Rhodococcus sp. HNM0569]NLU84062.1 sirohydrochlorin chelatase [Rhodococcus sp. HNM0569]
MVPLVAVAHGSRDPRSAHTISAAVDVLRARHPHLDVRPSFLDLSAPSTAQVLGGVAAEGHRDAVVVPLLLGSAFHARVDLPEIVNRTAVRYPGLTVHQADVLGIDRALVGAVRDRILDTGVSADDPTVGVAVVAVGSSRPDANRATHGVVDELLARTAWRHGATCFATTGGAGPREAVRALRAAGARRVVVAPWFLAPGLLTDRVAHELADLGREFGDPHGTAVRPDRAVVLAEPIGAHPHLADVVTARYHAAVARLTRDPLRHTG